MDRRFFLMSTIGLCFAAPTVLAADEDLNAVNMGLKARIEAGNKLTRSYIQGYVSIVETMLKSGLKSGKFTATDLEHTYNNLVAMKKRANDNGWTQLVGRIEGVIDKVKDAYKHLTGGADVASAAAKHKRKFDPNDRLSPFIPWDDVLEKMR